MKSIYKYFALLIIILATEGCVNSELTPDSSLAESGDEVKFGLSLQNVDTKTVYGEESGKVFPIYWVDGDKVQIFSPQCLEGRRSAEYNVTVSGPQQNYADALTRTGGAGVQWSKHGDKEGEVYDFYSLYPSGNYSLSSDGQKAENIVINYTQKVVVNGDVVKSDMEDCLMYAHTAGVQRGESVNLTYEPISTVVYVTLSVANVTTEYLIQSISLEADTEIAGTFSLNIANGEFGAFAEGKSSKTVFAQIADSATGGFLSLSANESVSIPLFLAPVPGLKFNNWKLKVVANNVTYTKTITIDTELTPGQIHKVVLPPLTQNAVWVPENWMQNIPRNVYLSEVSLPGSWDTINAERQGDVTIEGQYSEGVRAFHYDTRWRTSGTGSLFGYTNGTINALSVAGSAESAKYASASSDNNRVVFGNARTFEDHLDDIVAKLTNNEYMVLVCTFAQDSYDYTGANGQWYGEISAICAKEKYNDQIYDARKISSNTVVGDVLGRLIVIVNMSDVLSQNTTLPKNSKCFFTYLPSKLEVKHFNGTDDNQDNLWTSSSDSYATTSGLLLYNNQAQVMSSTGTGITHNERGYAPSETERTNVLNNILSWSKDNYSRDEYEHDMWIYLGIGGYQVNSASSEGKNTSSSIAQIYNKWINEKVKEMGTVPDGQTTAIPFYPVGIVLMNFVTDNSINVGTDAAPLYTKDVVKNVLLLNNRYQLQFDPNKPADWNPNAKPASDYDATANNGGNVILMD